MESPSNFKNSPEGEGALNSHYSFKYGFSQENLDDIPHPDECSFQENKPITMLLGPDDLELPPLPPEYKSDKPQSVPENQLMNISQPHESEYHLFPAQIPLPEDHSSQFTVPLPRSDNNTPQDDLFDIKSKFDQEFENNEATMGDSAKYSPSKIDSDEENCDFTMVKPKVLGKEQAKKRLLAFSLSKQPTPTIKKQNKVAQIPKNIKEKPPNPNKSTGVQDQFRATISEIEEEKRKMMQNMPNYLLSEMSDLAKATHPIITSSLKLLEKHKATDSNLKSGTKQDDESLNKSEESNNPPNAESEVKDNRKSKSPNRSYRRSRSRSRDGKYNRRNRDSSKSRRRRSRSKSPTKKSRDRYMKRDKRDTHYSMYENWKAFKASFTSGSDAWNIGSYEEDMKKDRENRRSVTPSDDRRCFKPTFNYLKKEQKFLKQLKARSADSRSNIPALFLEKKIKYTKTKPMLIWSENPSVATDFYMSRQMLLDNCDSVTTEIVNSIINSKGNSVLGDFDADGLSKIRKWYSFDRFLRPQVSNLYDEFEIDGPRNFESGDQIKETTLKTVLDEKNDKFDLIHKYEHSEKESAIKKENDAIEKTNSWDNGKNVNERRVNLVNDTYLSDNENASGKLKEVVVGDVKVQMNIDMNCVKVRSRWDSDYECENSENEETERTKTNVTSSELEAKVHSIYENKDSNTTKVNHQNLNYYQQIEDKHSGVRDIRNEPVAVNDQAGNLASEYEEFLKMVSFDYDSSQTVEMKEKISDDSLKLEKGPSSTADHSTNKFQKENLEMTDWDKDSDHESKLVNKINSRKSGYEKEFLLLEQDKLDQKPKKEKKVTPLKKKSDKLDRREKTAKKSTKGKKKKQGSSSSSDSSSDSDDSYTESDSDSDNNVSSRKKRKKIKKTKKKHKKSSSSSASDSESESDKSDSDSDVSREKKKITKKKKDKKKKKDSSSESDEGRQTVLLKQLDFKKQLIMKKIEEIDTVSERNGKKKVKENKQKKKGKENSRDEESLEKYLKLVKKKKSEDSKSGTTKKKGKQTLKSGKGNKETKKRTGSSDDSSDEEASKVKSKKKVEKIEVKKKRDVSKSSNSDFESDSEKEDKAASNRCSKSVLKKDEILNKNNKIKRKSYSSSDSDSDDSSLGEKNRSEKKVRNKKEEKNTNCSWKDDFVMEDDVTDKCTRSNLRDENLEWKEMGKKPSEKVTKRSKDDDDWEASSSEESAPDSKSRESWEEEAPCDNKKINKTDILEENFEKKLERESRNRKLVSELAENTLPGSANVKTSFPHFSLIDNNFGNLGQDFSSDFRLSDSNCSKSETAPAGESIVNRDIDSQSSSIISKINYQTNVIKSELYSPGHSDSDVSESEERNESNKPNITSNDSKGEKYDPLNSESETSVEDGEDLNNIPLPCISDKTLTPGKAKILDLETAPNEKALSISEMSLLSKSIDVEDSQGINFTLSVTNHASSKFKFKPADFSPSETSPSTPRDTDKNTIKKQIISVKSQPKLKSKAASVFQEDSDESPSDVSEKTKEYLHSETDDVEQLKKMGEESSVRNKHKKDDVEKWESSELKDKEEARKERNKRERSKERSESRSSKKRRSSSREKKKSRKSSRDRVSSPTSRKRSKTPEVTYKAPNKESKREIRSDSFEIEPLKSAAEYEDLEDTVQPIPVLTGLGMSSSEHRTWTMFPGYTCTGLTDATGELIDPSESFDIYPEDSAYGNQNNEKTSGELFDDKPAPKEKKERRRSRSRSSSLRKRRRSKSPEKRKSPRSRSPRRRSRSPKRRGRSPYSPRRKSPKRKSPNRRYRSSRSPDRRRKSRSRSPRKRRSSPARRSRSFSPRSHRRDSPRRRGSPSRGYSPRGSVSPRRDDHFSGHYSNNFHNRIPVIGVGNESLDRELSPSNAAASPIGFLHHSSTLNESGMNNSFFNRDYTGEFGAMNYPEELSVNNLITVKNHDSERGNSPERLSLDQRIELELGVPMNNQGSGDQYQKGQYQDSYQNSYNCENGNSGSESFYSNHSVPINSDYNSSYYNGGHPPSQAGYGQFHQYPNSQNSMLQVGNIVEVVPTMQHSHSSPATPVKSSNNQIMQVGNVLQVVPSQKSSQDSPMPFHGQNFGPSGASLLPPVKTQKATAVVAPSSIVPQPNPEAMINPLIKAIQMEREKRKMEKKKRKEEREARRKARQLRREAKLMSVNEKLKKSVQDEGLMLGQEVEDDELLDGMDLPSPPIPVEIITVSSASALPPAGKGILITAGFMPKPPSEKKEVKFADGVLPGEGTSSSGEEDIASPPPKPKLPKEKRYKKKKTKVKKKVKVQIIKEIIQDDDDEEDDLSPPPPPPGDPPPIYFARFPFAGDAQFPVYQMQTTTTTLTTVQYPAPRF